MLQCNSLTCLQCLLVALRSNFRSIDVVFAGELLKFWAAFIHEKFVFQALINILRVECTDFDVEEKNSKFISAVYYNSLLILIWFCQKNHNTNDNSSGYLIFYAIMNFSNLRMIWYLRFACSVGRFSTFKVRFFFFFIPMVAFFRLIIF